MTNDFWYRINNELKLITPGLLVYPDRIKQNIESMIRISGDVNRLIPHVKTYKMKPIVKMQMQYGIKQFKCATLGELSMLIDCKVNHILLSIQPTKEKAILFLEAQINNPEITFSTLVDNYDSLQLFSELARKKNQKINLWLDINNGMNRTGIIPESAVDLYLDIEKNPNLIANGIHVYDGHIRPPEMNRRLFQCNLDFEAVDRVVNQIQMKGIKVPNIITGGSPSFYPHSLRKKNLLSPGTTLLWDYGYQKIWKDSPFLCAAVITMRLISIPKKNIYCFDLGHKAVSSEMPLPRVKIFGLEDSIHKSQSEEHLIIEYTRKNGFKIGDLFYAIPYHICPTVAKYASAQPVYKGEVGSFWNIEARDYQQKLSS